MANKGSKKLTRSTQLEHTHDYIWLRARGYYFIAPWDDIKSVILWQNVACRLPTVVPCKNYFCDEGIDIYAYSLVGSKMFVI
jgi:hypothetical protein